MYVFFTIDQKVIWSLTRNSKILIEEFLCNINKTQMSLMIFTTLFFNYITLPDKLILIYLQMNHHIYIEIFTMIAEPSSTSAILVFKIYYSYLNLYYFALLIYLMRHILHNFINYSVWEKIILSRINIEMIWQLQINARSLKISHIR